MLNGMKIFQLLILIISIIIAAIKIYNSNIFKINNGRDKNNNNDNNINEKIEDNKINQIIENYDLIIAGAGLSGLTAAYEASKLSDNSLKILLLEASSKYGGNSNNEIDGINLLIPPDNYEFKNNDNFTCFYDDSFDFGRYASEKDLLTILVGNSYELYDFLFNELDCNYLKLIQSEGSKVPRTLIYNNGIDEEDRMTTGGYLSNMLYNKIKNISSINILFNANFVDLVINEDYSEIKGVIYQIQQDYKIINVTAKSKAIILATGGYGSDFYAEESILKEFLVQYYYLPTFSTEYTQGVGLKIGRNKGGVLIDQRQAEIYPTCFVDLSDRFNRHKIIAPDLFRELGGILMNKRGKRFCDEMSDRRFVGQSIIKNCNIATDPNVIKQYEGFLIINEEIKEKYGEKINYYISKGYLKEFESFDDFANYMKISEYYTNIRKSIISYNQAYDQNRDIFGKGKFPTKFKMADTIYVGVITPCIFHTLGGIRISENAEILNEEKRPIKGLYAAGQIIGGIHGVMSMQGNILTQSVVFGRLAAKSAVNYIKK